VIKTIYLARRNPATSYDQFVENWRRHAVLSGSFPEVGRRFVSVIQCRRVLADLAPELGLRQDIDGANLLGLTSLFDAVDVYNQDGIATLRQDELRVFSDYVSESSMTGIEHILLDGERQGAVVLDLVSRRPGDDLRDFLLAWTGRHAQTLMHADAFTKHVRRYVHNQIVLPTPAGWPFDGIAELWFDDVPSAVSYLETTAADAPATEIVPGFRTLLEVSHRWIRRPRP
jgi:EthD domain